MATSSKKGSQRLLVLYVDRDDDLGVKASIKTPIVGREENLTAAVSVALHDPEEADANAMFEAVRLYDHLKEGVKTGEEYEIATIAGSELGGVGADRKLVTELTEVLRVFPATDVILVSDGYSDEAVLPLVQSRVPVTSVRRIVVKHSKSVEETVALFSRYLKTLVQNPRYSRIVLGLPGILMIVLVVLSYFNLLMYTGIAFLVVLGAVFIIKGFSIDKAAKGFYKWIREYSPPPFPVQIAGFSAVAGIVLILVGGYLGATCVTDNISQISPPPADISQWITALPKLAGWFISGAIALIVIGICVLLSGRAIRWFFERDPRIWRTIVIVDVVAWSWSIFYQASMILIKPEEPAYTVRLIAAIVTGVPFAVAVVLIVFLLHKKYGSYFKEKEKEKKIEEFEEG